MMSPAIAQIPRTIAKTPIYLYRYIISPVIGPRCRHLPTCSQYALEAIELNGAWAGSWLAFGRLVRCHPWGTSGYDPPPNLRGADIPFWMPWRYVARSFAAAAATKCQEPHP